MSILTGITLVGLGFLFGIFRTCAMFSSIYTKQIKASGHVAIENRIYKVTELKERGNL